MEATILESWDIDYSVANRVGGMIDAGGWANWPRNDSPKTPLSELHGLTIEDLTVKSVKQARTRQYPLNLAGHQIDVHNVHVMGWSFECVLGGGYGPTLFHHNVVESCNKPGKIVAGGGALNLNGSRSTADHNRINAVNWGGETASSITTFDANEIVCRKPGATGFTIGSSVSGLFQISFTNNVIRNCATALQSGNGQGVQTEIAIVSNLFDRTGSVTLLGGLESSALTYGYRSPVAHFPATIKGNTWVDPPGGAIQIGGTAQQYGLDPVSIADNTVIYARNYCVGGPHAGSACQFAVADCGSSSETSPEYPCQVAGPALYVYGFGGATLWQPSTAYAVGGAWNGYVVPVFDNGHVYRVTVAGTSASREPTWPTDGTTVTSGGATFIDAGPRPWVDVNNFRLVGMTDGIRASNQGMIRFGTNGLLNNNPHVHLRNVSASFDWHLTSDGTAMLNGEGFTEWIPAGFALSDDRITRAELDLKYSCPHNSTYCDAVASFLPYGTAGLGFTQTKLPSSTPNLPTTITITRAGQIAPAFAGSTAYAFGALVRATTDNGHVYKVTVTGTSSSEPSWCTSTGCTSTSGGVTFQETGTSAKWQ